MTHKKIPSFFIASAFLAAFIFGSPALSHEAGRFARYKNRAYNYTLLIPVEWNRSKVDLEYKHILTLSQGRDIEIKVTAAPADSEESIKWKNWKEWYTKGVGGQVRKIIESREDYNDHDQPTRILLFEYRTRRDTILERVMIAESEGSLIVIECKAPLRFYKRYIRTFNTVMGSLDRIEKSDFKDDSIEDEKDSAGEEKTKPPKPPIEEKKEK